MEPSLLPSCGSQEQLANDFGQFFHDKIETIMTNLRALPEGTDDYKYVEHDFEMDKWLHKFTTIPYSDIIELIKLTTSQMFVNLTQSQPHYSRKLMLQLLQK